MTRNQFLILLRKYARKAHLDLEVNSRKGKGSHIGVSLDGKHTIVQDGELTPFHVSRLCKQLGFDDKDL